MVAPVFISYAREQARAKLIDCAHHSDEELDAAAEVLSRSNRAEDVRLGEAWREMRAREVANG